jgi:hypothetical protein
MWRSKLLKKGTNIKKKKLKTFMRSSHRNLYVRKHHDAVRIHHCVESMCNCDDCAMFEARANFLLNHGISAKRTKIGNLEKYLITGFDIIKHLGSTLAVASSRIIILFCGIWLWPSTKVDFLQLRGWCHSHISECSVLL